MSVIKSIFIIVRDHQARVDLRLHYEADGHHVVSTATTTDALHLLQNISIPDLIIVGGSFPFLSASDFLNILKLDNKFQDIPVAIIKSSKESQESTCLELNMKDRQTWSEVLRFIRVTDDEPV